MHSGGPTPSRPGRTNRRVEWGASLIQGGTKMAKKKEQTVTQGGRSRPRKTDVAPRAPEGVVEGGTPARQTPDPTSGQPPPGLDAARHAAAQRVAHQADALREGAFPA